ncbi:glycosyltransferase family 2 protein [Pasteurellaceae bacterium 22721_9_1]
MNFAKIDVIIPCYNAENTLIRAVTSVLNQPHLGCLWLVDDCSTDNTAQLAAELAKQYPDKIKFEAMPRNGGPAKARNWGALQSSAEFIAFLDADDAYEADALTSASAIFHFKPEVSLIRLALKPVDLAPHFAEHENIEFAWQHVLMTVAGNMVFRRSFFLACGGFPQNELFRRFGGEDGALGIATTKIGMVVTLKEEPGVLHYCRSGMHAERLLNAILFQQHVEQITETDVAQANAITENICQQIERLKCGLNSVNIGIHPLILERE